MMAVDLALVPEQIAELGRTRSSARALSRGESEMSYGELNYRADCFAAHLEKLGVMPGGTVALCLERSFDWIVAALGIMRAGAAYVPLDQTWPLQRLRQACIDSGASVLAARAETLDSVIGQELEKADTAYVQGVDPTRDAEVISSSRSSGPLCFSQRPIPPESVAYVIFTSGSSGTPKGVEITHANLQHLVSWHRGAFAVCPADRASHLLGLGFDACVMETWAPLAAGATLCLAPEEARSSPELLKQWLVREEITITHLPTALSERLLQMDWPKETRLRLLITGGDTLRQGPRYPLPFEVVNNYGPTECTVSATWSRLQPGQSGKPPIGRPISGASVYLLDEVGARVGDGEIGEIYIGGNGVGNGYRNLPEQTRRCFLADPFSEVSAARMYRTGDRGRWRADGELEFCGRLDRQIKIRGFRIELDEVSAALSAFPGLAFATVAAGMSEAGENQLIAYVLPEQRTSAPARERIAPTPEKMQEHLLKTLPEYMVPAVYRRLDALPLSANGKIDLALLEISTSNQLLERAAGPAPGSAIEERLLALTRQLLHDESVGVRDNFFLVGGHSLLGMQLLMRLGSEFGVELSLRQLFEAPSVGQMARVVGMMHTQKRVAEIWAQSLGRSKVGMDDPFFDLGGNAESLAALQRRVFEQFHEQISIEVFLLNPTVRQQAKIIGSLTDTQPSLPPGVLALQPNGTRKGIFWIHYFNANLAKLVGEDQPFLVVRLMAEDFIALGESPTLERIAACHVHKILATQPHGPYTVGGLCLGAVLAFEIAHQLRAARHEVALVVMLDPPGPDHLGSPDRLGPKLSQPGYLLKRAARLGPRTSFMKLRNRLFRHLAISTELEAPKTEIEIAQDVIEVAASAYRPEKYTGKVLLLLATERPPHLDFLPGWQELVPNYLHTQYLDGHHEEMTRGLSGQRVAEAIFSHLATSAQRSATA